MAALSVGQVARRAGVGVEPVRFYERQGLLAEPARKASGYRQYGDEAVAALRFIRRAKLLGFTLKEIKGASRPAARRRGHPVRRAGAGDGQDADIEDKIRDLRACGPPSRG